MASTDDPGAGIAHPHHAALAELALDLGQRALQRGLALGVGLGVSVRVVVAVLLVSLMLWLLFALWGSTVGAGADGNGTLRAQRVTEQDAFVPDATICANVCADAAEPAVSAPWPTGTRSGSCSPSGNDEDRALAGVVGLLAVADDVHARAPPARADTRSGTNRPITLRIAKVIAERVGRPGQRGDRLPAELAGMAVEEPVAGAVPRALGEEADEQDPGQAGQAVGARARRASRRAGCGGAGRSRRSSAARRPRRAASPSPG